MNLEIRSFADVGDLSKERVILKALTDLDVGEYALFRSGIGSNDRLPTSGRKTAYWFPDQGLKANDLAVIYTKKGSRRTKSLEGGRTAYFFYWGKEQTLWDDNQFGVVLLKVEDWQFKVPSVSSKTG
jgi:hypothetical protein